MTIEHMAKQIEEALAVLAPAGKRVPADRQSSEAQTPSSHYPVNANPKPASSKAEARK
jgi:hypothetical protein